jgi:hypothetical protein
LQASGSTEPATSATGSNKGTALAGNGIATSAGLIGRSRSSLKAAGGPADTLSSSVPRLDARFMTLRGLIAVLIAAVAALSSCKEHAGSQLTADDDAGVNRSADAEELANACFAKGGFPTRDGYSCLCGDARLDRRGLDQRTATCRPTTRDVCEAAGGTMRGSLCSCRGSELAVDGFVSWRIRSCGGSSATGGFASACLAAGGKMTMNDTCYCGASQVREDQLRQIGRCGPYQGPSFADRCSAVGGQPDFQRALCTCGRQGFGQPEAAFDQDGGKACSDLVRGVNGGANAVATFRPPSGNGSCICGAYSQGRDQSGRQLYWCGYVQSTRPVGSDRWGPFLSPQDARMSCRSNETRCMQLSRISGC